MATSGSSLSVLTTNPHTMVSSQTYQLPRSQSSPARGGTASRRYGLTPEDDDDFEEVNGGGEGTIERGGAITTTRRMSRQRDSTQPLQSSQSARSVSNRLVYVDPVESLLNEYEERRKKIVKQKAKELLEQRERELMQLRETSRTAAPSAAGVSSDVNYLRDMFADHQKRIEEIQRVREERLRARIETRNTQRVTLEKDEKERLRKEAEDRRAKAEAEQARRDSEEKARIEEQMRAAQAKKEQEEKAAAEAKQKREEEEKKRIAAQKAAAAAATTPPQTAPSTAATPPTQTTATPATATTPSSTTGPKASQDDDVTRRLEVLDRIGKVAETFVDKKMKMSFQGRINTIINQLSMDRAHTIDRIGALKQIFAEAAANPNQAVYCFCLKHFATKIVNQENVESAPHTAFPIAFVMVALSNHIADIADLIVATFYTRCPYTIPSYKISKDVKDEQESREAFYSRMTGFMILFAAFIQTPPIDGKHPYPLSYGWRWLSRILNNAPKAITATLLLPFVKIAGYELERRYGRQFQKLLGYIVKDYEPRMQTTDSPKSSTVQLRLFIEKYISRGCKMKKPQGKDFEIRSKKK
eukprot:TRINITY_DN2505_c0_g1_i1.p1 TRINITY_DN2505_c0_g1~~TRINITY_DN2505_c0_g1_i1.p1  ORF type:complete len:585 (-),score=164.52 TRINITY_DN2505_c0_g1_i1:1597-3351(-)